MVPNSARLWEGETCVCVCVRACVRLHECVCQTTPFVDISVYGDRSLYVCVCMCACTHHDIVLGDLLQLGAALVCVYTSVCVCMCVRVCMYACTHHDIVVGDLVQVGAALGVGELTDPDAVGRVKLLHQEPATRLHYL